MQRTLAHLRELGYLVDVVERRVGPITKDLFGIADVVAVGPDILAVQTTTGSNVAARVRKITDSPALPVLRKAGIRVLVHGWRKVRGGRWRLREVDLSCTGGTGGTSGAQYSQPHLTAESARAAILLGQIARRL